MLSVFDILGWVGSIMVVLAYALLSAKKIKPGLIYQLMNFFAALLIAIGLFPRNAWFSFALQVVWALVAIIAIIKLRKKKK
ncbi:hypothetical protein IKE98_00125 [Candidatus Saccharibacteria bacterium]|nr:hypothetical protein [Candidatus Saccharibacteria bacterium]